MMYITLIQKIIHESIPFTNILDNTFTGEMVASGAFSKSVIITRTNVQF